jgi:hypothetical protein
LLIFAGWNGFIGGVPAFRLGCSVCVVCRGAYRAVPVGLAHGSWNGLVQSYFSSSGAVEDRVFTESRYLLGEFGWLGAAGMVILGVGFVWWHFRTPTKDGCPRRSRPVTSHR